MVSRAVVQSFFDDLRTRGESLTRPMRWAFYFCDHRREPLERLVPTLVELGFTNVEIWDPDPTNDDQTLMFLQLEIVEVATADSLFDRCERLRRIGEEYGVESFDGFDVGSS